MNLVDKAKGLWQTKTVRQAASLFSVNILGIPLGIVTNIIVTKYLGARMFGDYKFICSVFNFAALIATFGFFQAGNRAIVLSKDKEKTRGFYGALLIILAGLFVLMTSGLLLFIHFDANIAQKGLTEFFACVAPLGFITLWGVLYETVLPADNQIGMLSRMRFYPKVVNLVAACALYFLARNLQWNKLLVILLLYNLTQLAVYVFVAFKLRPSLRDCKERIKEIAAFDKSFGLNVYIGSLFAVGLGYLTEILISYFGMDNTDVGFYSLALTLTQPLAFIPATIATTHYKSFAGAEGISRKLLMTTLALSAASVVALWVIVPPFIKFFYGNDFLPVIGINFIVCIAIFLYGLADFYNRFIQANGQGARLRNASFVVGLTTLAGNLLLIPKLGAYGAAYSRIITGAVYLGVIYFYYIKTVKEIRKAK